MNIKPCVIQTVIWTTKFHLNQESQSGSLNRKLPPIECQTKFVWHSRPRPHEWLQLYYITVILKHIQCSKMGWREPLEEKGKMGGWWNSNFSIFMLGQHCRKTINIHLLKTGKKSAFYYCELLSFRMKHDHMFVTYTQECQQIWIEWHNF